MDDQKSGVSGGGRLSHEQSSQRRRNCRENSCQQKRLRPNQSGLENEEHDDLTDSRAGNVRAATKNVSGETSSILRQGLQ